MNGLWGRLGHFNGGYFLKGIFLIEEGFKTCGRSFLGGRMQLGFFENTQVALSFNAQDKNLDLDLKMKQLARSERELLSEVIICIKQIEKNKLYLERGYSSLFSYLTQEVGYSMGSAQRRIDAARLSLEVPQLVDKIKDGEIKLSQVGMIQKAARYSKKQNKAQIKKDLVQELAGLNEVQTQARVAQVLDVPVVLGQKFQTQKDHSVRIELTLTQEQFANLQSAQALLAHAIGSNDLGEFINYVSKKIIKQKTGAMPGGSQDKTVLEKSGVKKSKVKGSIYRDNKKGLNNGRLLDFSAQESNSIFKDQQMTTNQENPVISLNFSEPSSLPSKDLLRSSLAEANRSQNFLPKTKKQVLNKLECCQYQDPETKKNCGSRWFLQVDHIKSKWTGGSNDISNATLLCAKHNRLKYLKERGAQSDTS
jgi:hypothetical protein